MNLPLASLWLAFSALLSPPGQAVPPGLAVQGQEEFTALRQPVLGLGIEVDATGQLYRLIATERPSDALVVGTLDQCQERLVDLLRERYGRGRVNLQLPTLGGVQLWTDAFWYADWRIQEHVYTGHFRLLDPADQRIAWGTREACRARFEAERTRRSLSLESSHLVVLLHGLGRSRQSLQVLKAELAKAGFAVAAAGYPSTRGSIAEHAAGLESLLASLDDVERVSFVTHSLGGIVVRKALASSESVWRQRLQLGRVVMLAPPNQGSELARSLSTFSPFRALAGPSAEELLGELEGLPAPACPFGIVSAARESEAGLNPLIEGDDDGIVAVLETRLEGAADTLEVKGLHTFLMSDPEVVRATVRFLRSGRFRVEEESAPR